MNFTANTFDEFLTSKGFPAEVVSKLKREI